MLGTVQMLTLNVLSEVEQYLPGQDALLRVPQSSPDGSHSVSRERPQDVGTFPKPFRPPFAPRVDPV